jgi:hypothetical protein
MEEVNTTRPEPTLLGILASTPYLYLTGVIEK